MGAVECREEWVETRYGRMRYLRAGAGRPVILIHGLVGSSENWRSNIGALSEHAEVFAIDQMNMGRSQRVAGLSARLQAHADRIDALMESLGLECADIAGHSHGGAVAMMLAARHPSRVRSLLLFAPANPYCNLGHFLVRFYSSRPGGLVARLVPHLPARMQQIALERMYGDPARVPEGCLERYVSGLRVPGTMDHVRAIVRGWFDDMEALRAVLPRIHGIPAWMVWGDRDRAVGLGSGRRLSQEIGSPTLVVVPGAGHVVFEELPQVANRIMLQWLKGSMDEAKIPVRREAKAPRSGRVPIPAI